jgi:glycopeptide antibiotics resistance protein
MVKNGNIKRYAIVVLLTLICVGIFYFSWISDSQFSSETYLPLWLRDWSNSYFNLRTAVPFVAFGFLLEAWLSIKTRVKKNRFYFWFKNLCIAFIVVCVAEGGQFFILNRHPDVMDVLFGVLGSQIGFVIFHLLKSLRSSLILNHNKRKVLIEISRRCFFY